MTYTRPNSILTEHVASHSTRSFGADRGTIVRNKEARNGRLYDNCCIVPDDRIHAGDIG